MRRRKFWLGLLCATTLASVVVPSAPAAAQVTGPDLAVSPSTDLSASAETVVTITVADRTPNTSGGVGLCPSDTVIQVGTPGPNLLSVCTQLSPPGAIFGLFNDLDRTFDAAIDPGRCVNEVGCDVVLVDLSSPSFLIAAVDRVRLEFEDVVPPPPPNPDFALTITPNSGLVDQQAVTIDLVNRNPATVSGSLKICPADIDPVTARTFECRAVTTSASLANADDFTLSYTLNRGLRFRDCANEPCTLAYVGEGSAAQPFTEVATVDLDFAPAPAIFSASSTTNVRIGDVVSVSYNPYRPIPASDPVQGVTIEPLHFVGICAAFPTELFETNDNQCAGVNLPVGSGTAEIPVERFVDNFGRTIDCLTAPDGCTVSYYYGYQAASVDGGFDIVDLHFASQDVTYEQSESINGGASSAPLGSAVSVETVGSPTNTDGAVAFVMLCGLDGPGLAGLFCDPSVGTVEADFDGDFSGSIDLPASISDGTRSTDCTTGLGCIVVFAVIDSNLDLVDGVGQWVLAETAVG
jgi:hypothetical protein